MKKVLVLALCAMMMVGVVSAHAESLYPRLCIVIEVYNGIVICQDKGGNLWAFYNEDDEWEVGDICNLLMDDNSDDITEHEIVEVFWEGYTENIDLFFVLNGWC